MKVLNMLLGAQLPLLSLAASPTITLTDGVITGTATSVSGATATVNKFLGIPFAQPPVKDLRWALPQPAKPWPNETKDASKWSAACLNQFVTTGPGTTQPLNEKLFATFNNPAGQSEDCLYLNVYVPDTPTQNKAVLFWIYGGSLQGGTAMQSLYDGTNLAGGQDVVVVAANYRLNVFGFPGSPELPMKERNLGFYDQRLALQWVQTNIEKFGGDPTKVTLWGESSGSASVDRLITSPPKDGIPFRAAILESGTTSPTPGTPPLPGTNEAQWSSLTQLLGCSTPPAPQTPLSCMRAIDDASKILAQINTRFPNGLTFTFRPIEDGVTTISNPSAARLAGNIAKVPIMQGTNANEGRLFALASATCTPGKSQCIGIPLTIDPTAYLNATLAGFPASKPNATAIAEKYFPVPFGTPYEAIGAMFTELVYLCPAAQVTADTASISVPTWRFYYNYTNPVTSIPGWNNSGAYHSSELYPLWGNYETGITPTTDDLAVGKFMQTAWANFAKDPTGGPDPKWPKLNDKTEGGSANVGVIGSTGRDVLDIVQAAQLDSRCSLWADIYKSETGGNPF
ncbi:para-nitrobenzyl esterase [Halenospora varia]|nr:para-nitrobenzyl esterase [Halenospora varia]